MSDELVPCQYCKSKISLRRLASHIEKRCPNAPPEKISARNKKAAVVSKHAPHGDQRHRVHKSIRIWVMAYTKKNGKLIQCGVLKAIERVVCDLQGELGLYVRYDGKYYPIHGEAEFARLVAGAKNEEYDFFHNEIYGFSGNPAKLNELAPSSYIIEGEAIGPCYNLRF